MKSGWLLAVGMVLGFAAGSLAVSRVRPPDLVEETKPVISRRKSPRMGGAEADPTTTRHVGRVRERESQEPRVPIPVKEIAKVISRRLGEATWFPNWPAADNATYSTGVISDIFPLLEASDSETQAIREIFQNLLKKLQAAESRDLEATQTNPFEVVVDFSKMAHTADEIFAETETALRSALPGERGNALALAISSQSLYRYRKSEGFRLLIERDRLGELWLKMREPSGGGSGSGLSKNLFPDNGTPIPVDQVLGARWHAVVAGMTLLPVDGQ